MLRDPRPALALALGFPWLAGIAGAQDPGEASDRAADRGGSAADGLQFTAVEGGHFEFDTGFVRGRLQADGGNLGIVSLVDDRSGRELVKGVGALSVYRIFSGAERFEDGRVGSMQARLLSDGAVEVRLLRDQSRLEITVVYRWTAPDTLDLEMVVESARDLASFEVFLSSYFATDSRGLVFVQPNQFEVGPPRLMAVDVHSMIDGAYLMFPRDPRAARDVYDGRWDQPPHPVRWAVPRWMAGPLVVRRDEGHDLAVAIMAPPEDCFAIAAPYNRTPPDGPSGHASLYLSLFGRDLSPGEVERAHTRMIIGRELSEEEIIERYERYRKAQRPPTGT